MSTGGPSVSVTAKPCYPFGGQISVSLIDLVGITARLGGINLRRGLPTFRAFSSRTMVRFLAADSSHSGIGCALATT